MNELKFDHPVQRGEHSRQVRLIQEWLCLHGIGVRVDGVFGPATQAAVIQFQQQQNIPATGEVDQRTFISLTDPMRQVLKPLAPHRRSIGQMVMEYAEKHLLQHPREIGGQNRGPWVRLYMNGRDGPVQYWCAGFVSFILQQAYAALKQASPFITSASCNLLARRAEEQGQFLEQKYGLNRSELTPGALFLSRRAAWDWNHTGIVTQFEADYFHTIEGNTNDSGDPDGYEVCRRLRSYEKKDFIRI